MSCEALCSLSLSLEVIAANEGTALAMAAGHYLATGSIVRRLGIPFLGSCQGTLI